MGAGLVLLLLLGLWGPFHGRPRGENSVTTGPQIMDAAIAQAPASQPVPATLSAEPEEGQQGPALRAPREIFHMLDQRRKALDEREEALAAEQGRLTAVKEQIRGLIEQHKRAAKEASEARKKLQAAQGKRQDDAQQRRAQKKKRLEVEDQAAQARIKQVAKIYEAMPPEEAAARIEKLPTKTALKVLQLLKSRAAGNILAQVNADKAAKLTEQYLSQ